MNTEIARITYLLEQTYDGNTWHGSSINRTLENGSASQATARTTHCPTMAELVKHVTAWLIYALEKLWGNARYDSTVPEQDWPPTETINGIDWQPMIAER